MNLYPRSVWQWEPQYFYFERKGETYRGWVQITVDVIDWHNVEPQASGLDTILSDLIFLPGFVAIYRFNDASYITLGS